MQRILLLILFIYSSLSIRAQVFTGNGGIIKEANETVVYTMEVSGLPETSGIEFGLEKVCINVKHTWISDLAIRILSPSGRIFTLVESNGGNNHHFTNTCFHPQSEKSVFRTGNFDHDTFKPIGDVGVVNDGSNLNGTWKIILIDYHWQDEGELVDWSLTFSNQPAVPIISRVSDLPIIKLETDYVNIIDDPKLFSRMHIIDHGPGILNHADDNDYAYSGYIGIEHRGSSSQGFPKKSYGLETWDENGEDLDVSLFGMPEEADWILNAHYADKSLIRNNFTYEIARRMGHYAPRTKMVELYLNNEYRGAYSFMEKIKRGKQRVNIPKISKDAISGSDLTGGYLFKIDRATGSGTGGWSSTFPIPGKPDRVTHFLYEYPKDDDITPAQEAYLQNFVYDFEYALFEKTFHNPALGWRNFADEKSFVDFMLIQEMSKNVDAYRLSTFLYKTKDSDGNKIHIGPVWDFDIAWMNADYCYAYDHTGWAYNNNFVCDDGQAPFWWEKFMSDTTFTYNMDCRWSALRGGILSDSALFNLLDQYAAELKTAQERNFQMWDIMGHYVWPNPQPIPADFTEEYNRLKNWLTQRLAWMDNEIAKNRKELEIKDQIIFDQGALITFNTEPFLHGTYDWTFGNEGTATGPIVSHNYGDSLVVNVSLKYTSALGCEQNVSRTFNVPISTNNLSNQFHISPNPTGNFITVNHDLADARIPFRMIAMNGKEVLTGNLLHNNHTIDVSVLPTGVYQLVFSSSKGIGTQKFIKK